MDDPDAGCGGLYALYAAARDGDVETTQALWPEVDAAVADLDESAADRIEAAQRRGATERVRSAVADVLFVADEPSTLDDVVSVAVGELLFAFGYVASFVLFVGAHTTEEVVGRLRWAYRTVGVDIRDTESVDGTERTVFRCPYRSIGAGRYGPRRVCHDVLDQVDEGYVTWLARHRDIDYVRPRACAGSACCYSVVSTA